MGFDCIMKVPLLSSCCGFFFVFGCMITSLIGSSLLYFDGYSAVSFHFGVFMRGGELKSFYSAILLSRGVDHMLCEKFFPTYFISLDPYKMTAFLWPAGVQDNLGYQLQTTEFPRT